MNRPAPSIRKLPNSGINIPDPMSGLDELLDDADALLGRYQSIGFRGMVYPTRDREPIVYARLELGRWYRVVPISALEFRLAKDKAAFLIQAFRLAANPLIADMKNDIP